MRDLCKEREQDNINRKGKEWKGMFRTHGKPILSEGKEERRKQGEGEKEEGVGVYLVR